jgi:hypothetical protein
VSETPNIQVVRRHSITALPSSYAAGPSKPDPRKRAHDTNLGLVSGLSILATLIAIYDLFLLARAAR